MNHMKEGTGHVYKIKYNYSIAQIFWRELNKYPNEEMKPTYFLGGSKECAQKNARESEGTSEMVNIQILPSLTKKRERKQFRRAVPVAKGDACSVVETGQNLPHSFQQLSNPDKKVRPWRRGGVSIHLGVTCEEQLLFVVGREPFGKLQDASHVFACTHLSICAPFPFLPGMNLCWLAIMWLGETKEWDPNRHSALWRISTARMCCHYMSNPHLRQRRLPSGPSLQLNILQWRSGARQSLCTVWLHSFVMFIGRWQTLFICDSTKFLWPQCPDSTRHPHPPTPNFSSLDTGGKSWAPLEIVSFSDCVAVFQCPCLQQLIKRNYYFTCWRSTKEFFKCVNNTQCVLITMISCVAL